MQQALRRPDGAADTRDHIELGAWEVVDIEDYEPGDEDLLRCLATACHGMVRPRHKPFPDDDELQCFVHFPGQANSLCPFYKTSRKRRSQQVMIEVYGELLAELRAAGTLDDPNLVGDQLRIDIERDGHPVVSVVYLDPMRARQLTDAIEGQELFVVTVSDLKKIARETLAKALARGPIRVVSPSRDGEGRSESELYYGIGSARIRQGLVGLETAMVDWEELFEIELASCNVWIQRRPHEALQVGLKKALREDDLTPEGRKVLRLLAKRVLVDGAAVHEWIFKQRLHDARRFTKVGVRFPRPDDLVTLVELIRASADRVAMECISGNLILRGLYEELKRESSEKAQRDLERLRARIDTLDQELAAEQQAKRAAEERAATRVRELKAAAALVESQRDEFAAAEKEALESAASLEEDLRQATAKADSLEIEASRVKGLSQRLEAATLELAVEKKAKGRVEKSLHAARTNVDELTQENEDLTQNLASADERKKQLQKQLKSARAASKRQEELIGDLKSAQSVAEKRQATQQERVGGLEKNVADLRSERRRLQSKVKWSMRLLALALAVALFALGLALTPSLRSRSEPARPGAEEAEVPAPGEPGDEIATEEGATAQRADAMESTAPPEPDPPAVSRSAAPATIPAATGPRPARPEPEPVAAGSPKAPTEEPPQRESPIAEPPFEAEPPPAPVVAPEPAAAVAPEPVPPETTPLELPPEPEAAPASIADLLAEARQLLSASPEAAFYGKKKNELASLVGAARAYHLAGRKKRAAGSLGKAIDRTNGCSERGVADTKRSGRDWITDCTLQKKVYGLLLRAQGTG